MIDLGRKKIAIVSHIFTTGPSQELEKYLKRKVENLIFIGHPLPSHIKHVKKTNSFYRCYYKGILKKEGEALNWKLPDILLYIKDFVYTILWTFIFAPRIDLFVGCDNLNALSGLVLKLLGKVKKTVYLTIDYNPHRFENKFLNAIYHEIDSVCVKHCDKTWNLSSRMVTEREKKGLRVKYREKQITVPIGVEIKISPRPFEEIHRYQLVYMGVLLERQGLQLVISVLGQIKKLFPETKLLIIGTGPFEENLKEMVYKLNLEKIVEFKGMIESHDEVLELLSSCAIGLATYTQDKESHTQYTDPGKPKAYLSIGMPVIITKVPQVAFEIEKEKCGFAINYDKDECFKAITRLLKDDFLFGDFRENARSFASKYSWDRIFQKALENTFNAY